MGVMFFTLPALTILLIECSSCGNSPHDYNCQNVCEAYHRISLRKCSNSVDECGGCVSGYLKDTTNDLEGVPYHCFILDILKHPPLQIERIEGRDIVLDCQFNSEVKCLWMKNDHPIVVGDGDKYKYQTGEVQETHDCTLLIKKAEAKDSGKYVCTCKGTSSYEAVQSPPVQLSVFKVVVQPETQINESYSTSVILTCSFNHPVRCDWNFKNKQSSSFTLMTVAKNLAYVNQSEAELNRDCSIVIKALSGVEEGDWMCRGQNQERNLTILSRVAHVKGYTAHISQVNIYLNGTMMNGEIISMTDIQSIKEKVMCVATTDQDFIRVITKSNNNNKPIKAEDGSNKMELNEDEILSYLEEKEGFIVVQCNSGQSKAFVVITNQEEEIISENARLSLTIIRIIIEIFLVAAVICLYLTNRSLVLKLGTTSPNVTAEPTYTPINTEDNN